MVGLIIVANFIIMFLITLLKALCCHFINEEFFALVLLLPSFVAFFFWLVAGVILRYRHIGNVCSGDFVKEEDVDFDTEPYLWKSGKFMNLYVKTLTVWIPLIVITIFVGLWIYSNCCR